MSQKEVLRILKNYPDGVTTSELREQAKKEFPERALHSYIHIRLDSLKKRGLVTKHEIDNKSYWRLTEEGDKKQIKNHSIENACDPTYKQDLKSNGVEIVNIVGVVYNNDDINLYKLSENSSNTVYNPEADSHLTYYPTNEENVCIRIPSTGTFNIAGAKSKEEIYDSIDKIREELSEIDYEVDFNKDDIMIQNIVGMSDLGKEINLEAVASDINPDNIEYNPKNSPAVIFRPPVEGTVMIYRTGKIIVTGLKSYLQMVELYRELNKNTVINQIKSASTK